VQGSTVDSWKERLPEIVAGYKKEDIWNMDESGVFWRALPDKGFGEKRKACKGGKKSKNRLTVAFFVNAAGEKEKPIVIWKSANPRCLRQLPVTYYDQKKAWMTGEIMETVLGKLNARLSHTNRSILLLMDNAGCHPDYLQTKFSNIKTCFLPANTTSKLQPLDLGIIKNFKVHYRRFLLRYVLSKIDECETASEIVNGINLLIAIRWITQAWKMVKAETICKCFRRAGILDAGMEIVSCDIGDEDPFADIDEELQGLITDIMPESGRCTAQEYINGDCELATCNDMADETWDETFMSQLGQPDPSDETEVQENEEAEEDILSEPLRITSYKEAINALEDVQNFLESQGHVSTSITYLGPAVDAITSLKVTSLSQRSLHDYFS